MKCEVTITGPPFVAAHYINELRANPPKDKNGKSPSKWDLDCSVPRHEPLCGRDGSVHHAEPHESTTIIRLTYPDPKPDIPALIKAWHAEPNETNMRNLRSALLSLDSKYGTGQYDLGGLTYKLYRDGTEIAIGSRECRR